MKRIAVPALVWALALATSACFGATITIPGDHATIGEAVAAASDGDIINVSPGTYVENVLVDKSVSIRGAQGADVTTVTAASNGESEHVFWVSASDVTISGFTITGATGKWGSGVCIDGYEAEPSPGISDVTISKCILEGNTIGAAVFWAENSMIVNNSIRHNVWDHFNTNLWFWGLGSGVLVWPTSIAPCPGTQIVNNEIYENDEFAALFQAGDVSGSRVNGNNLYKNGAYSSESPGDWNWVELAFWSIQGSVKVSGNKILATATGWDIWIAGAPDVKVVGNPVREDLGPNIPMPTP